MLVQVLQRARSSHLLGSQLLQEGEVEEEEPKEVTPDIYLEALSKSILSSCQGKSIKKKSRIL